MTLKEFAELNGINYATAKTWLRRGRIQKVSGGFQIQDSNEDSENETLKPQAETFEDSKRDSSLETLKPESETLKRELENLQAEMQRLADRLAVVMALLESQGNELARLTTWLDRRADRITALEDGAQATNAVSRIYAGSAKSLDALDWIA